MPKSLTPWGSNINKNPTQVTPVSKNAAQWSGDIVKNPTQYNRTGKNDSGWSPEKALQTYYYDDPKLTYDSPLSLYNYLVNTNTSNQRGQTAWSAS